MPKSRNKKGQKKRALNYAKQQKASEHKSKRILMEQFQAMQAQHAKDATVNAQKVGSDVINTDIDIDLDIDDIGIDDIEVVEMVSDDTETTNEIDVDTK